MSSPNRLIIGCGYLGKRVAEIWANGGDRIHVTTRSQSRARQFLDFGWTPLVCDVTQPDTLQELPDVEIVVFAVGMDRTQPQSMHDVYVNGLRNVLDRLSRPQRFIYISSSGVYGQTDGAWIDETCPVGPLSSSGMIVSEAETVLREAIPDAIVLRFAGIYGPDRGIRRTDIVEGRPIETDPDKWLNLIRVEDGARAVLAAATNAQPGTTFNICDDEPVRRRDFYREMARQLGAAVPTFVAPTGRAKERNKANRRIRNNRMKSELMVTLQYPTYREGLAE